MKGKALFLLCLPDAVNGYPDVPDFERFFLFYNKSKCFNLGWIFTNVYLQIDKEVPCVKLLQLLQTDHIAAWAGCGMRVSSITPMVQNAWCNPSLADLRRVSPRTEKVLLPSCSMKGLLWSRTDPARRS